VGGCCPRYPSGNGWYLRSPRRALRRIEAMNHFHQFLVNETEVVRPTHTSPPSLHWGRVPDDDGGHGAANRGTRRGRRP